MLEALGVEPGVEPVYRALLGTAEHDGDPGRRGAAATGAPRSRTALAVLVECGPGRSAPDEQAYVAAPPAVALGALITERRDGLRLAEQALATLAEEHRAAVAGPQHQRR